MKIYATIDSITRNSPGNHVLAEVEITTQYMESSALGRSVETDGFLRLGYAELSEIAGWEPGQQLVIELSNVVPAAVKEAA